MFRFKHYLRHIIGISALVCATGTAAYQKPGAPVQLAKHSYKLANSALAQPLHIELVAQQPGQLALRFSSDNITITETPSAALNLDANKPIAIELTVQSDNDSIGYIHILVTFTADNGWRSTRALSAKIQSGQAPLLKPTNGQTNIISMPASETIYPQE